MHLLWPQVSPEDESVGGGGGGGGGGTRFISPFVLRGEGLGTRPPDGLFQRSRHYSLYTYRRKRD